MLQGRHDPLQGADILDAVADDLGHGSRVAVEARLQPDVRNDGVFELTPGRFATAPRLLNLMHNLLRARRRGSTSFFCGSGSKPHFMSLVRRNFTSKYWPLCAIQMSYWTNSATTALRTARSSLRHRFHHGFSLSARNTFGRRPSPLTTPHKSTANPPSRPVVSRSKQQELIWPASQLQRCYSAPPP